MLLRIFAKDRHRLDSARAFYARVFGWSLPDDGRCCWVINSDDDPRLECSGAGIPTIHVADLDAITAAALAAGGEVLVARIPLPGIGWMTYLADTEGNLLGVMQDDPQAAWPRTPAGPPVPTAPLPSPTAGVHLNQVTGVQGRLRSTTA